MGRILLVDDSSTVLETVRAKLEAEGFTVATAANGLEALERFSTFQPDLVVLDWMMPLMDGRSTCMRLRALSDVPIIMLSARSEETDIVVGLELGADDYVCKPVKLNELTARVRAVLRRRLPAQAPPTQGSGGQVLAAGPLKLDARTCLAKVGERCVSLTPIEFKLLAELMKRPGEVLSREDLLRTVWQYDGHDLGLVCTHVKRLRAKIETEPSRPEIVRTVRGFGYMVAAA